MRGTNSLETLWHVFGTVFWRFEVQFIVKSLNGDFPPHWSESGCWMKWGREWLQYHFMWASRGLQIQIIFVGLIKVPMDILWDDSAFMTVFGIRKL